MHREFMIDGGYDARPIALLGAGREAEQNIVGQNAGIGYGPGGNMHLGNRPGIRIVGDRFVFQSEVLFASGAANLEVAGRDQMAKLAATLREVIPTIPSEINWVLRVDGHTDKVPISTPKFPSNWELSTARAISVVKFLRGEGIPPGRLAATGFGEYQPLDGRDDELALRRNRRIEIKLTES